MGLGNENRLQVPISEEVERTKLTIKQKAAELTKKTRSSFRRKNGGTHRKHKLPRERKQRRFRSTIASRSRNKINEDITEEFNGGGDDGDEDENDDDEGSLLSHFE